MVKLVIFGSGKGSNAENLIHYFQQNKEVKISLIVSNVTDAGILRIAASHQIPSLVVSKKELYENPKTLLQSLEEKEIDYIILAGFLLLIPEMIINAYEKKIINIHPSLLPLYGGKGMYGGKVHEAVIHNKETQSGITIHLVNHEYDKGEILFQAICPVDINDDEISLAQKIHALEYAYFPKVIERFLLAQP